MFKRKRKPTQDAGIHTKKFDFLYLTHSYYFIYTNKKKKIKKKPENYYPFPVQFIVSYLPFVDQGNEQQIIFWHKYIARFPSSQSQIIILVWIEFPLKLYTTFYLENLHFEMSKLKIWLWMSIITKDNVRSHFSQPLTKRI